MNDFSARKQLDYRLEKDLTACESRPNWLTKIQQLTNQA